MIEEAWKKLKNRAADLIGQKEAHILTTEDQSSADVFVEVTDLLPELGISQGELIRIAAGLTMQSECRQLAKGLLTRCTDMLVSPLPIEDVEYLPQQVFNGKDEGSVYAFGYADYFQAEGIALPSSMVSMLRLLYTDEKETFVVSKDEQVLGIIAVKERRYS